MRYMLSVLQRLCLVLPFLSAPALQAATIYSNNNGGGNWNAGSSWQGNNVPGTNDQVVIRAGDEIRLVNNQTCGSLSIAGTLNLNNNNRTLTVNGAITFTGSGTITGNNATREVTAGGNLTVSNGADVELSGFTLRIGGSSTITGDLTFKGASGTRTFTGDVTVSGGLYFTAAAAVAMNGRLTLNAGGKVGGGGAIGTITVANNLNAPSGATRNIRDVTISFGTNSSIAGTVTTTDADLSFGGNLGVNGGGSFSASGGTLAVSGTTTTAATLSLSDVTATLNAISVNGGASLSATNGTAITASGGTTNANTITLNNASASLTTLSVSGGASVTASNGASLSVSGATTNTGTISLSGSTGSFNSVQVGSGCTLSATNSDLSASGTVNILGSFTLNNATADLATLQWSNSGTVNAGTGTNAISLTGNWTNGSSAADPFVEGSASTVTFKGTTGTQLITRSGGTETFDGLVIASTSATSPGVRTSANLQVNDDFDHTGGVFDLNGRSLTVTGSSTARTHDLKGGARMISGVAGGVLTVTDPNNSNEIDLYNYGIGDNTQGVTVSVTCGRITFEKFTQWGTAAFTKTRAIDDVFGGGNYYHGPVTFTANSTASRWRMGDGIAQPDTFVNATFNANAAGGSNNNFIVCTNTQGNAFYGTTNMYSTTPGGFFIGRKNGAASSSATFHGPVVARVAFTGSIVFADAAAGNASSILFHGTIQPVSAASSTGDIYFGNSAHSTVTLSPTAQFIPGTLQGLTSIFLRNVTQNGPLAQEITSTNNTKLYCGTAAMPCTFNGPVTFSTDTLEMNGSTFHADLSASALSSLNLVGSTFNGGANTFSKAGAANSTCNGGNTFIAGSANTFTNTGTGWLRLAATTPDDMNGDARYVQSGTGTLAPAYGSASTYAGDISTVGTTTAIQFGSGANGTAVLDGSAQTINGAAGLAPVFNRLTLASTGEVLANVPVNVTTQLTMTSGKLDLNGYMLTLGTAPGTAGTLVHTSGWAHNGPVKRWFPTAAVTVGNGAGLFPVGTSTTAYHPLWFGSSSNLSAGGSLTVRHTPTGSGVAPVNFSDASWGQMVKGTSNAAWVVATGDGLAVNGTTGLLRYGGNGFTPFVLTDLDACQSGGAIGTFAASTSTSVPLEVNRTGLNTAALTRTWLIGTRNLSQSPLPIELLSFTARPQGDAVLLEWATATEQQNDHFTVERSRDAQLFTPVLTVDGAGDSQTLREYSALDGTPLAGTSYYRLKQTDIDGTSTWSDIVPVQMTGTVADLHIHPSPCAAGAISIELGGAQEVPVQLTVLDAAGRLVLQRTMMPAGGRLLLDRSDLREAGAYHVRIEANGVAMHGTLLAQ